MPLINTVKPEEATGEVAKLYTEIKELRGQIMPSHMMFSVSPKALKHLKSYMDYYTNHETLSPELLACIRMMVSEGNACEYCINFNSAMLINKFGWTQDEVARTKKDPSNAKLSGKEKAMLLFATKGVKDAHSITGPDVEALKKLGYNDADILDGLNHGAQMGAIDIIFDALKIDA